MSTFYEQEEAILLQAAQYWPDIDLSRPTTTPDTLRRARHEVVELLAPLAAIGSRIFTTYSTVSHNLDELHWAVRQIMTWPFEPQLRLTAPAPGGIEFDFDLEEPDSPPSGSGTPGSGTESPNLEKWRADIDARIDRSRPGSSHELCGAFVRMINKITYKLDCEILHPGHVTNTTDDMRAQERWIQSLSADLYSFSMEVIKFTEGGSELPRVQLQLSTQALGLLVRLNMDEPVEGEGELLVVEWAAGLLAARANYDMHRGQENT